MKEPMKRLSPSFLTEYKNRKDDPFESLLARMAYRSKYQRKEDEGWWDTLRRVVEANVNLAPDTVTQDEMEFLYSSFYDMVTLPAGRGLFQGGTNMPTDTAYNCFSGSTEFYADGTRWTFQQAARLTSQSFQVLCADGIQRRATVRSFGVQPTQRVHFRPWHSRTKWRLSYDVTPSHRWLTENRGEVTDLKVGDRVKMVTPLHSIHTEDYADGFAHGMVYGDGCLRERGVPLKYQLRLCGAKKQHHEALRRSRYYRSFCSPPSYNGDPHLLLESETACLKRLPPSDSGFDYVAGFISGVLAADGSRNKRVGTWQLSMQDEACVDYVLEHAHIVGLRPTGKNISGVLETNFGKRKNPLVRATFTDKDIAFEVSKIDELEDQEVFCVVEPETQSFVLAGGLKTGNCAYVTLREVKDWAWIARHAMCGVGVGVGYQEAHTLPEVSRPRWDGGNLDHVTIWCRTDHPDYAEVKAEIAPRFCATNYVVEDTREGWSLALYYTLQSAFDGKSCLIDVSKIRHRGSELKTFGGTASGPGPLVDGLRAVDRIVRKAAGRRLTILECADITNLVGLMTKMGNIRRVALINISPWNREFLDAKTDASHSLTYRHTANNSVGLYTQADVDYVVANAMEIAVRCATLGEPGFFNAVAARADSDPSVEGLNPCGEVLLRSKDFCCIAEVNAPKLETLRWSDREKHLRVITRFLMRERLKPHTCPEAEKNRVETMRIGVGMMGVCDAMNLNYGACYSEVRLEATTYARDELRVSRPVKVTTIKPGGTVPTVANLDTPGMKSAHAPYFLRRARIGVHEPTAGALIEAGVRWEYDVTDPSNRTMVFEFPRKNDSGVYATRETPREQLERQEALQRSWSDNAVSATISFPKGDVRALAGLIAEYVPKLKSSSFLPQCGGEYKQLPFEEISREEYEERAAEINEDHPLVWSDDAVTMEECAAGFCPAR